MTRPDAFETPPEDETGSDGKGSKGVVPDMDAGEKNQKEIQQVQARLRGLKQKLIKSRNGSQSII